jgi:ketosteroid isomerase-like protein
MSQENVELMRRVFDEASQRSDEGRAVDALNADSVSAVLGFLDPEVEFHEDALFPEAGHYHGVAAVRDYWAQFAESFSEFDFKPEEYIDLGEDRVLVLFMLTTRGKDSGARLEARPGWIFTIRNGVCAQIDAFLDRDVALQAAGLRE